MLSPRLVKNSLIAKLLRVDGIVLYPFIFFASKNPNDVLIHHEMIHVDQMKRVGVWRFYFLYLKEYCACRLKGMNHHKAYMAISFEVEAYEKEGARPHHLNDYF
ncbi:hypothetical protein DOM21_03125 [Bacteriovorax stolpii]|uniref:Uncharacterized protein n=1 Tax=Bacteriovorax stolpii TaxID=960 RepID=A0A2K9NVJ8_BACTC|nr:hypothetical protein [Bacteriovorax stolpii]AUN99543.1 hypothetical protein C0V70_15810 [Bacteriovorax stolpii]QDK40463.1 hypothetical protein DOM21_03125 [Bacteriovorax stolpii]TDP51172.1 hypothetical protein C8D79_3343 [Bacteriovorax stolpii]